MKILWSKNAEKTFERSKTSKNHCLRALIILYEFFGTDQTLQFQKCLMKTTQRWSSW